MMQPRLVILLILAMICASQVHPDAQSGGRRMLRAALFPYLPEPLSDRNESLRAYIEQEFERRNPEIDLYLRPFNGNDDFYTSTGIRAWLSPASEPGAHYDVVEIDTVLIGELVNDIEPWAQSVSSDWLPQAAAAVQMNGKLYGIPHWLCAHYIISRSSNVAAAKNLGELVTALASLNTPVPDAVGDLTGSWNMPALYLDAFHDTYPTRPLASAMTSTLDGAALAAFKQFSRLCGADPKTNPCLTSKFGDNDREAAFAFARTEADSLVGYSERLHYAVAAGADPDSLHIGLAPLGNGNAPLFFVDAFVARKGLTAGEQRDAAAFVAFMNEPNTHATIAMSRDVGVGAVPRYLLPATKSAYGTSLLKTDRLYQQLAATVRQGQIYPTIGLEKNRGAMRDALRSALERP